VLGLEVCTPLPSRLFFFFFKWSPALLLTGLSWNYFFFWNQGSGFTWTEVRKRLREFLRLLWVIVWACVRSLLLAMLVTLHGEHLLETLSWHWSIFVLKTFTQSFTVHFNRLHLWH
jgi:hypothetical protein